MSIFEPVTLTWKGEDHEIAPDRVMGLIARIEDVITLQEIYAYSQKGTAPMGKIAIAYAVALRYAGVRVRDDEVYQGLFAEGAAVNRVSDAVQALLAMMIPPEEHQSKNENPGK